MLSVALATYNEEKKIWRTLKSVAGWADEIVVSDGYSVDKTVEIIRQFTTKIYFRENETMFHINKNCAIEAAHGDWILFLDADEVVTDELKNEINQAISSSAFHDVNIKNYSAYDMPRANYFLGRFLKKGGQYPDTRIRLFKKGSGHWPCKSVHEQIEVNGDIGHLKNDLLHYSYESWGEYWRKASTYTFLTAMQIKKEKRLKLYKFFKYCIWKPNYTFFNIYIRHKGFMDSWQGFLFALFSAIHFVIAFKKSI